MGPQVDLDKEEEMGNNTVLNDAGKYTPNKQTPKTKNSSLVLQQGQGPGHLAVGCAGGGLVHGH